jgi:signal transduction histidine kinase
MTATRILVVEDDNIVAEYLKLSLNYMGYVVAAVCSYGEDSVVKAAELHPELVLMDIRLRGKMSGMEAAELIREQFDIPVIYLTAQMDDETLNQAKLTEPFGYILKPFREKELRTTIEIALYRHDMEKKLRERETSYRVLAEKLEAANAALQERKAFVESVVANIHSGLIVADSDFTIKLANRYVQQLCEVAAEEIEGKKLGVILPEISELIGRNIYSSEVTLNCSADKPVIGFRCFDWDSGKGSSQGHIIVLRDLTQIIEMRRELQKKARLATMGELVAKVAHEIRNPLFGMTAVCQIFAKELVLNADQQQLMDSLLGEAWRLKRIVDELLDCSRELKLDKKTFDLVRLLKETLNEYRITAEGKNVRIENNMVDHECLIVGDQGKIKQVMINLLENAIEASDDNGVIHLEMAVDNGYVSFSVEDAGTGISSADMEKIFDVFYTTKKHGTGLGLPISKNIVESHDGAIMAQNRPERGAVFTIALPLASEAR